MPMLRRMFHLSVALAPSFSLMRVGAARARACFLPPCQTKKILADAKGIPKKRKHCVCVTSRASSCKCHTMGCAHVL